MANSESIACNICNETCSKSNLSRHMQRNHKRCPYCEYITDTFRSNLKKHIKVNHPDEVFIDQKFSSDYEIPCKSCSKKFRKDKIQNHEDTNHIPCNFCEYFTESYTNDIDDHIQEKHPEKTIFRKCFYHDSGCHFRSHSRKKIRRHQFSCYNFYNKD